MTNTRHPKPGMELIQKRKPAHQDPPFGIRDSFVSSTVTFIKRQEQGNKMKQTSVRSSAELQRASCQTQRSSLCLSWNERTKPLTTYWAGPSKGFRLGKAGWCFVAALRKHVGVRWIRARVGVLSLLWLSRQKVFEQILRLEGGDGGVNRKATMEK